MAKPLSGVVLAGGASRRLGVDKAGIIFGGRPLLEIVVERLARVCDDVMVARDLRTADEWTGLGARFVIDRVAGRGPLAGLEAGLRAAAHDFVFVVACDMPFLSPGLLRHMAELPRCYEALVPRLGGRCQMTHAIYTRSCLSAVESLLAQRGSGLIDLLPSVAETELSEEQLRRYDPGGLSFFNLNSPQDLILARAIWERREQQASDRLGGCEWAGAQHSPDEDGPG